MARISRVPSYLLHKPTGQARVRINGKDTYLGMYGSAESRARYREMIERWQRQGRSADDGFPAMNCGQLALLYLQHAESWYRKNGKPTSQVFLYRSALRALVRLYKSLPLKEFGPVKLRAVRDQFIDAGCCRETVNRHTRRVIKAFRWAVSQEFVSPVVVTGLETVEGLQAGRTTARDHAPVKPVPQEMLAATMPLMTPLTRAVVTVQLLTGMRPSEALAMRACDLKMDGPVWEYAVTSAVNKMTHKRRRRVVMIGPRAQAVLKPFISDDPQAFILTPNKNRRKQYCLPGYRRAINRACEVAYGMPKMLRVIWRTVNSMVKAKKITEEQRDSKRRELSAAASEWRAENCWSPNRLRHSFGTAARKEAGIEAASAALGHGNLSTTEIYAERNDGAARDLVGRIG